MTSRSFFSWNRSTPHGRAMPSRRADGNASITTVCIDSRLGTCLEVNSAIARSCALCISAPSLSIYLTRRFDIKTVNAARAKAKQVRQPFGPHNRCRNGECGELVEMCCRFQHYCCGCASGNLGMRAGEPAVRITMAHRRRRRIVGRVLLCHKARPPPCVVTYILDHLMNDLGKLSPSMRWACILIRSGVQLE